MRNLYLILVLFVAGTCYAQCANGVCNSGTGYSQSGYMYYYPGYGWYTAAVEEPAVVDTKQPDDGTADEEVTIGDKPLPALKPPVKAQVSEKNVKDLVSKKVDEMKQSKASTGPPDDVLPYIEEDVVVEKPVLLPVAGVTRFIDVSKDKVEELVQAIGKVRSVKSMSALKLDTDMCLQAQRHCLYMVTIKHLSVHEVNKECVGYWNGKASVLLDAWLSDNKCSNYLLGKENTKIGVAFLSGYWCVCIE